MTVGRVLGGSSALIERRYSFAGRTDWLTVFAGRQSQRRPMTIWLQIEKIILRRKKDRPVIASAAVALFAEVQFRSHVRVVAARHVVRDKVDQRFHVVLVN